MKQLKKIIRPLITAALITATATQAGYAQTAEEKGLAIAVEADKRDEGFGDYTTDMEMILYNRKGEESVRYMRSKTLEVTDDGDKSLSIFEQPNDVKGTAMLTFTHKSGPDDQWLYMPALKRVKRISSSKKSGSFMGSEFANEDLASQEVEKYRYKYIGTEQLDGKEVLVLERYPVDKHSGYTRQVAWIDKSEYRFWKVDYYDRKKTLLKTLTFAGYQKFLDKHWRPAELFMKNHQTGKSTRLKFKNYKFKTGLTDADFNRLSLKRMK